VARFVNAAEAAEIVWTRNTTEGINLVSFSWGLANLKPGDAILTTRLEHHSNLVPWQLLAAKTGAELRFIDVDADGLHVLDDLDIKLRGVKLVALSHVSNTLGTIAPLEIIVPRAHAARARARRRRAVGAAFRRGRARARRRLLYGERPQDVRPDRYRLPVR
jgi:cysteine desulfurase/selenocysteine lyase